MKVDKKEGIAQLTCRVCDQRYQSKVHRTCSLGIFATGLILTRMRVSVDLTEPVDIYAEWQDAADEAAKQALYENRPAQASASRARPTARRSPGVDFGSDDE